MTQGQSQVNVLTISQFAKACRSTPRTIRFYHQQGLLKPTKIDRFNNYRYYHPKQVRDFLKIKLLQNFQFKLKSIKSSNKSTSLLKEELGKLAQEIEEKKKQYLFLKKISSFLKDEGLQLTKKQFGPCQLICARVDQAEYNKISFYIKDLWQLVTKLKLTCHQGEMTFYLDNNFQPRSSSIEVALALKDKKQLTQKLPANYYFKHYPKTTALVFNYLGPYEFLPLIYKKLYDQLELAKVKIKGLVFEKYVQEPTNTQSKYDYLTEIAFPV